MNEHHRLISDSMEQRDFKRVVDSAGFGYSCHKLLRDNYGEVKEIKTLHGNTAFEYITGLSLKKKASYKAEMVFPGLSKTLMARLPELLSVKKEKGALILSESCFYQGKKYALEFHAETESEFYVLYYSMAHKKLSMDPEPVLDLDSFPCAAAELHVEKTVTFVACNNPFKRLLGFSEDQPIQSPLFWETLFPDKKRREKVYRELKERASVSNPEAFNGETITENVEKGSQSVIRYKLFFRQDHQNVLLMAEGITGRQQMEEAVIRSESKYKRLAENMPAVVYQFRLYPDGSFDFPFISASAESKLGVAYTDIIKDPMELVGRIQPDDRMRYRYLVDESAQYLKPYHSTFRFKKKDHYIWLEAQATPEKQKDGSVLWDGFFLDVSDRVDAEEALRKSEEKFRSLVENLNEIIYVLDKEARIAYISPNIQAISGYSAAELIGKCFVDIVHPDDKEGRIEQFQKILSGVKEATEYRFITKDQRVLWMRTAAKTVFEEGKPVGVRGVLTDITDRKIAELELEASTNLLNGIFHSIDDGICVLEPDFTIRSVNHAMKRWFSHEMPLVGKKCYEAFQGRNEPCEVCSCAQSLQENRRAVEIIPFVKKGDTNGWLEQFSYPLHDSKGNVSGVVEFVRDVTDRILSEEALKSSEKKYRSLFENLTTGFALHSVLYDDQGDVSDYRFEEVNPAFENMMGLNAASVIGKTLSNVLPESESGWKSLFDQVIETGNPVSKQNYNPLIGKYFDSWVFKPEEGKIAVVFSDITGRIKAEKVINENLREKNVLLSEIHHRVKNNMAVISSLISLQSEFGLGNKSPETMLQETQNRIKSMALVHEMVYESDNFAVINFSDLLQRVISNLEKIYVRNDREISIQLIADDAMLDINNSIPLSLLVNELVLNAYKHAFNDCQKGNIEVRLEKKKDRLTLIVEDNGGGVEDPEQLHMQGSFGYTLIHGLVQQVRGHIEIESKKTGLKIRVSLPYTLH
ncbi:PAS domain S-box protein [Balneolaceae bacterium ANBcel3]|nr:PAS domain S-box protein [Balneolaceae bacterium ANBcel3]